MKTHLLETLSVSQINRPKLAHLLNCGWTAEYRLRLKPIQPQEPLADFSREVLPLAFESVAYSLRSVLLTQGCPLASRLSLVAAAQTLHGWQFYEDTALRAGFLGELLAHQQTLCSGQTHYASVAEVDTDQAYLLGIVEVAVFEHERYLIQLLGLDAFVDIVTGAPDFLRKAFLDERLQRLFLQHVDIKGLPQ